MQDGKNDKAVEACDLAIRTYPNGDKIPDAYYNEGSRAAELCKDVNGARDAWEARGQDQIRDSRCGTVSRSSGLEQIKRPN